MRPQLTELEDFVEADEQHLTYHRLINNPLYADVLFTFAASKQKLHGHNCILEARAPGLMKNAKEKKGGQLEVEVSSAVSYDTFLHVLHYVYLGKIEFEKLKIHEVVLVLAATNHFDGLQRLKWICEQYIKKELSMKNAHLVLKELSDLKLKLRDYVMYYAVQNCRDCQFCSHIQQTTNLLQIRRPPKISALTFCKTWLAFIRSSQPES